MTLFWLPFFILSFSIFSLLYFSPFFPKLPTCLGTNFSKHNFLPGGRYENHVNRLPKNTSKSVRTPSFKEAMKSAARPLLLPRNKISPPLMGSVSWRRAFHLKRLMSFFCMVLFFVGGGEGFLGRWFCLDDYWKYAQNKSKKNNLQSSKVSQFDFQY